MKLESGVAVSLPVNRSIGDIKALLQAGARADCSTSRGRTPLAWCVGSDLDADWRVAVVGLLLAHGADPNATDSDGRTPLHLATCAFDSGPVIRFLVDAGAQVGATDIHGDTPLHDAVWALKADSVGVLLELGADEWMRNANGFAPVDMLRDYLFEPVDADNARQICRHFLQLRKFKFGFEAWFSGRIETAVMRGALWSRDAAAVEASLKSGADPDARMPDEPQRTATLMLQRGVPSSVVHRRGFRALHYAVAGLDRDSVRALLAHGADPDFPDHDGNLPLDMAESCPAIEEMLVRHGASWSRQ